MLERQAWCINVGFQDVRCLRIALTILPGLRLQATSETFLAFPAPHSC